MIHNRIKFTSQLICLRGWMVRSLCWRLSQPGFDPSYGKILSSYTDVSVDDYGDIHMYIYIVYISYICIVHTWIYIIYVSYIYIHIILYIFIYIYTHVWLNNEDTFCLYHFIKILSSFWLELVDELTKIVPSAFGFFIGHHQGLLACIKCIFFKNFFERVLVFL